MFKIQIFSDLHTELLSNIKHLHNIKSLAPNVALLGDIGNPYKKIYKETLQLFSNKFENVYVIAGNHEFYKNIYQNTLDQIHKTCEQFNNVKFLNKTVIDIDNFKIIGCTLWSNIPDKHRDEMSVIVNDYHQISYLYHNAKYKFDVDFQNDLHKSELKWLEGEVEKSEKNIIVLTHHAPTYKNTCDAKYIGKSSNCVFMNNLDYLFSDKMKLWCYGHTHYCNVQTINGTLLASNQYGYRDEKLNFKFDEVYEINSQ
jgi:predicted phosphodiesterase